jgi:hypothetical protein
MPKRRYERREPTHEWSHIRPLLKDAAQIKYELIRPVILWGVKERAAETGEPRSTPLSMNGTKNNAKERCTQRSVLTHALERITRSVMPRYMRQRGKCQLPSGNPPRCRIMG